MQKILRWLKENGGFILGTTAGGIIVFAIVFLPPIIKHKIKKAREKEEQAADQNNPDGEKSSGKEVSSSDDRYSDPLFIPGPDSTAEHITYTKEEKEKIDFVKTAIDPSEYGKKPEKGIRRIPQAEIPIEEAVRWKVRLGGSVCGKPIVCRNSLYIACSDFQVISLKKETGEVISRSKTWSQPIQSPILGRGLLYVVQDKGNISAFSISSGKRVWNHRLRNFFDKKTRSPLDAFGVTVYRDSVFVSIPKSGLYVLSGGKGTIKKIIEIGFPNSNYPPEIRGSRAYFTAENGNTVCMDWSKKETVWTEPGISGETMFLTYKQGKLYTGTNSGQIYKINAETGKTEWEVSVDGVPQNEICFDKRNVYITSDYLYSIDIGSGTINWKFPEDKLAFARGAPVEDSKSVFIATQGGVIYRVDKKAGLPVKKYEVNAQIRNPIAIDESLVFVSTTNKEIMAINVE